MPRKPTGGVQVDTRGAEPVYPIRFRADGRRRFRRLGTLAEGWTRDRAEEALRHTLADVERGIWQPPVKHIEEPAEVPGFHRFASDWLASHAVERGRRGGGLTKASKADLEWRLSNHLLRWFGPKRLDEIAIEHVDRFRLAKVRENVSPSSVNKLLTTLAAILEVAVEYGYIERNPAKGKRRRLASATPQRSWLDRAEHIVALLDGASELDKTALVRQGQRRALLATLIFAGLRVGEALSLWWRDVDLSRGTITLRAAKTDAGVRVVNVLPVLRDELADYRARLEPAPETLVFGTTRGQPLGASNVRRRILAKAVEQANRKLAECKQEQVPKGLTPHSLRRTFASILFAVGESPPYVMGQMGHTTPNLTLSIYARQMDRRDGEPERLKALVQGEELVPTGTEAAEATSNGTRAVPSEPLNSGISPE